LKTCPLLLCALIVGCAGGPTVEEETPAPDWVAGASARYPDTLYLLGRGVSRNRDDAEDRARADLAKNFEVAVNAESSDVQTFSRSVGADGTQEGGETRIMRSVEARTDRVLTGVEIADLWRTPDGGEYHALAILGRASAAQAMREDIRSLDEKTRLNVEQAGREDDLLQRIAAAERAVVAQTERADVARALHVVQPSVGAANAPWSLERLVRDRDALFSRLSMLPRGEGDYGAEIQPALAAAVSEAGFHVATDTAAPYQLSARLEIADLGLRGDWYLYKGELILTLRDRDGRERGSRRWDVKGSSSLESRIAQTRAVDAAVGLLKSELRAVVLRFAGVE